MTARREKSQEKKYGMQKKIQLQYLSVCTAKTQSTRQEVQSANRFRSVREMRKAEPFLKKCGLQSGLHQMGGEHRWHCSKFANATLESASLPAQLKVANQWGAAPLAGRRITCISSQTVIKRILLIMNSLIPRRPG